MQLRHLFITFIVPLSISIPILISILNKRNSTKESGILFYYLIISGLINLTAIIVVRFHVTNLPLLHLYTIIEAVFMFAYLRTIFSAKIIKKVLSMLMWVFPVLCIINFTFFQSIYTFNTYTRPLEAILITFFCLLYLYQNGFTENWLNKANNWFNMGILIYFPAACIIFISSNYLVFVKMNKTMNTMLWNIHAFLVLLMYLFWARGFSLLKND